MSESEWTKILGRPGYRVCRSEIKEAAKTVRLWVRRNQTTRFLDSAGRLLGVADPAGHRTRYQYDDLNLVTQTTGPVGNTTAFTYGEDPQPP